MGVQCNDSVSSQLLCALQTCCNMSFFCRGWLVFAWEEVTLLILFFSHCSWWVNVISLHPCKLLWKSADSEDENVNLDLVNEFSCQVRRFPGFMVFFLWIISAFLSVLHWQKLFSEAAYFPVLFHLFPSGIDIMSEHRKTLPRLILIKLTLLFPPVKFTSIV